MFCTNCGARIGEVNFCRYCGTHVDRDDRDRDRDDTPRAGRTPGSRGFDSARRKVEEYVRDPQRTQELLATALKKDRARRNEGTLFDEIWDYLQVAARLVQASVRGEYTGMSGKNLALILGAIIYYISPVDVIPDFLPVAGLLDDVTLLAFALRSLKGELDAFKQWEAAQGRGSAASGL